MARLGDLALWACGDEIENVCADVRANEMTKCIVKEFVVTRVAMKSVSCISWNSCLRSEGSGGRSVRYGVSRVVMRLSWSV